MKKRQFHIMNWEVYQARTDKDLPWCKLWGTLFSRPWFQKMTDSGKFLTIVLLDLARKTGNRIGEEYVFIEYLRGNYGILSTNYEVINHLKSLSSNGFLSDNTSDLQDKIRQDKRELVCNENKNFDLFYSKYPKKQGKNDALKAFVKLNPNDSLLVEILAALSTHSNSEAWTKEGGKFIPLPATWIRGRRWEDELQVTVGAKYESKPFPKS